MSARVYNPAILTEISRLRTPTIGKRPLVAATLSGERVKRDLFGRVDPEDTKKLLDRELTDQHEKLSKKWGFDFKAGLPIENHDQYQWERVPPTVAPACFTPMVTLTPAAHVVPHNTLGAEDLMDIRAERENCLPVVRTHPLTAPSSPVTTVIVPRRASISCSISSSVIFSSPPSSSSGTTKATRQQRITDYLKERKRLAPTAPKMPLAKRLRQLQDLSAAAAVADSTVSSTPSNSD